MKNLCFGHLCLLLGLSLGGGPLSALAADEVVARGTEVVTYTAASQHAMIGIDGMLRGQVHSLAAGSLGSVEAMQLSVIAPDGVRLEAVTDSQGSFAVPTRGAGVYCVMGRGTDAVLSQAIRVHASADAHVAELHFFAMNQLDNNIELALAAPVAAGLVSTQTANAAQAESLPTPLGAANGRVQLTAKGQLMGQLWSQQAEVLGTEILIFQNGMMVGRALANPRGEFELPLAPGTYGLLASGPAGHAALGFVAVAPQTAVSAVDVPGNVRFIALAAAQITSQLGFGLSNRPLPPPRPSLVTPQAPRPLATNLPPPMSSFGGGGFGGGGFGGGFGGGGGGGGGLGGLLGIGGIALGAAALATNDNNNPIVSASGQ